MTLIQIAGGVLALLLFGFVVANALKGVVAHTRFVDADLDGEPDASAQEKADVIEMFEEEQARRHPDDV